VRRKPTNWKENETITTCQLLCKQADFVITYCSIGSQRSFQMAYRQSESRHRSVTRSEVQTASCLMATRQSCPSMSVQHHGEQLGRTELSAGNARCRRLRQLTGGPSFCSSSGAYSGPSCLCSAGPVVGLADRLVKIPLLPAPITRPLALTDV
jgi:hypothetical protein